MMGDGYRLYRFNYYVIKKKIVLLFRIRLGGKKLIRPNIAPRLEHVYFSSVHKKYGGGLSKRVC